MPKPDHTVALSALFREHRKPLRQYLARRLSNSEDARELAQEAYLRLLRVSRASLIGNPQGYLYRIASNLVYEFYHGSPPEKQFSDEQELECLEAPGPLPEEDAERRVTLRAIGRALNELSPKCRAVVLLFWHQGLSQREIAAELELSKTMVQKYLAAGLAHCRKRLRNQTLQGTPK